MPRPELVDIAARLLAAEVSRVGLDDVDRVLAPVQAVNIAHALLEALDDDADPNIEPPTVATIEELAEDWKASAWAPHRITLCAAPEVRPVAGPRAVLRSCALPLDHAGAHACGAVRWDR